MKSVFIHEGLEIRLECPHDELTQGAHLSASLTVTNRSSIPREAQPVVFELRFGSTKEGAAAAEQEVLSTPPPQILPALPPGGAHSVSYAIALDPNAPISEKQRTPFIYFGIGSGAQCAPLTVSVMPILVKIYELLESSFQFVFRSVRSSKGWSEAKFKPSAAPRFSLVEELTLATRMGDAHLVLTFKFKVKRFSATASTVEVRKDKSESCIELPFTELLDRDGNIRYEYAEPAIAGALESVASGV